MTAVDEYYRTAAVIAETRATYRQLTYWVESGWLHPVNAGKGPGFPWLWTEGEVQAAKRIVVLLDCGFNLETALVLARDEIELLRAIAVMADLAGGAP